MKRLLILVLLVGCGDSDSDSNKKVDENNGGNNTANNSTANNVVPSSDSLNSLSAAQAQALCAEFLDETGYLECPEDFIEFTPPELCGDWFSNLPACATTSHFRQCLGEVCTNQETAACAAILGECTDNTTVTNNTTNNTANNTTNNTANNTSNDGDVGDPCHDPDQTPGSAPADEYASVSGNTNGCKFSFSQDINLSCVYDVGSGDGVCEYTCYESDAGTQGSCQTGTSVRSRARTR